MNLVNVKTIVILLFGFLLCGSLSGCATVFSGPSQEVKITSTPEGAHYRVEKLTVSGPELVSEGKTPSSVSLKRKTSHRVFSNYLITLTQNGFEPAEVPIETAREHWLIIPQVITPVIGWIGAGIDDFTGANMVLDPDEVNVRLTPSTSSIN